jgi:hypothetical protein
MIVMKLLNTVGFEFKNDKQFSFKSLLFTGEFGPVCAGQQILGTP